ncbi:ABC transporter permease [Paracoccus alkanivorans]|uniref:ABC transporter permease n=1 Tax=Paracoccus alkanivorans TaxID=2116655 RepID=A0A3M0MCH2_9RHOB|nr:ABC transporter permease [Paracoccus alkanivorans]RMC33280.1 ABC transporter permease [Paracoccus alkanivorans]
MAFRISRTGLLFALIGLAGLALPFVQFKPNRIVPGEGLRLFDALSLPLGWMIGLVLGAVLIAGCLERWPARLRLTVALLSVIAVTLALGAAATQLTPPDNTLARVSPSSGFWLLLLAFALMLADAQSRITLGLPIRLAMLIGAMVLIAVILGSGVLDGVSVMREYAARSDLFAREAAGHLVLAFGSLGLALLIGLPLGVAIYESPAMRRPVLGILNILQTIPSLALFGIMIPIFGWIAANIPGAAQAGVAGIGLFPALVALFLYSLLPVVSNTLTGLIGVNPATREAAAGLGMTRPQILVQVLIPLALPVLLAAIRIVLVQNIGLAVIAGLIGGGGFGTFVFQGLNQTAMDLVLLGALPTIALALVAGIALDLLVEATGGAPKGGQA